MAIDPLIHHNTRLTIIRALARANSLTFNDLKHISHASPGALSTHARRLEDAKYIAVEKTFVNRIPQTRFSLTERGRQALERYLDQMQEIIANSRR